MRAHITKTAVAFAALMTAELPMTANVTAGQVAAEAVVSVSKLAGRWAGQGKLIPASGPSQPFRCVITYFPTGDGSHVRQNLRCQSPSYKFDAVTRLDISGSDVSGTWEDRANSLNGTVTGAVNGTGFDILLSGMFFEAKMSVVASACEQSVKLVPTSADMIRELSASLRKC